MASFARIVNRQGRFLGAVSRLCKSQHATLLARNQKAFISTSDKKKDISSDIIATNDSLEPKKNPELAKDLERLTKHFENLDKDNEENYISYGWIPGERDNDWFHYHFSMFFVVTIGICGSIFIITHLPDVQERDWIGREAYLELDRRERLGLPLIDPDYVDPKTIILPPDEEVEEILL